MLCSLTSAQVIIGRQLGQNHSKDRESPRTGKFNTVIPTVSRAVDGECRIAWAKELSRLA